MAAGMKSLSDAGSRDPNLSVVRHTRTSRFGYTLESFFREAGLAVKSSSFLDLGVTARTTLAIVFLSVQVALLVTAGARPDGLFAFRMFNESSTISIELLRRVRQSDGSLIVVPTNGTWQAKDANGVVHALHWNDRVRDPILGTLGRRVAASYGVDAQLFRLQGALDDVARNIPEDDETKALVARVAVVRNGHERFEKLLESVRPTTAVRRILRGWQTEIGDAYLVSLVRAVFGVLLALSALRELDELRTGPYFGDVYHLPLLPEAMVPNRSVFVAIAVAQLVFALLVAAGRFARPLLLVSASLGIYLLLCDRLSYHNNRYALFFCRFCWPSRRAIALSFLRTEART